MTNGNQNHKKKLIEVALPLDAINKACVIEASPFTPRHPRSLHVWWARRRLAISRAVIFAQMVDDPSAHPDIFPTEKKQEKERQRLFKIIENLVLWENTTNEEVLQRARDEIWQSWRYTCAENADHPRAKELFDRYKLPAFHDPFAGGGSLPLEAQRLGLEAYASDLNPVAVLINKAMIEIPPKFAGRPPVNPEWQNLSKEEKALRMWKGAQGLAEDVRYYGKLMQDEAEKRIGHLYPKIEITTEMAKERQDLKLLVGKKLSVIAWLWVHTVKSPNPAFSNIDVPLASTFILSTKSGKEAYVEPVKEEGNYRFTVKLGKPKGAESWRNGTKLSTGANFRCLMSESAIEAKYIRSEAQAGRMGTRMMAIVAEGERGRLYLPPSPEMEAVASSATITWKPELKVTTPCHDVDRLPMYGMPTWGDAFTPRQLVALKTFSDLVQNAQEWAQRDSLKAGLRDDGKSLRDNGTGAQGYAEAVAVYFGLAISRWTDLFNKLSAWNTTNQNIKNLFSRQVIPMVWDYAESNPFGSSASFRSTVETIFKLFVSLPTDNPGHASQQDARLQMMSTEKVVSTDPPYYDNICYAELSDFFYVWLRPSLRTIFPDLFATLAVPKVEELVASIYRYGSKENAEAFFLEGMTQAMHRLAEQTHPSFPVTIYYAFKQSESKRSKDTASTGWETFLDAVIRAGFAISGTWPVRTERTEALKKDINALASSIVLVCRPLSIETPTATRREFLATLKAELPIALAHLQRGNIAPVDLAQAAIGPGMAIYTRYAKILDAEGKPLTVREALTLINQILDEVLAEQEGDFDSDSRWALAWFEQFGFSNGEFGVAETLSKAKNTSVGGIVEAGLVYSKGGKVRLLKPDELPEDWDPSRDKRLTVWEMVHQFIRALGKGEQSASELITKLGMKADIARELAYRLYTICERKKRAQEALTYNALVQSWPEIIRLARETKKPSPGPREQQELFE
jgi:putative DNA methylase